MTNIKQQVILLENEIRNFYAEPKNRDLLTSEDLRHIASIRGRQEDDYDSMMIMYFTTELNYLKKIKDKQNGTK